MSWFDDAVDAEARCGDKDMMIASFGLVVRIGTGYCDQYLLLALIRSWLFLLANKNTNKCLSTVYDDVLAEHAPNTPQLRVCNHAAGPEMTRPEANRILNRCHRQKLRMVNKKKYY